MPRREVIVVGSGVSGLSCAHELLAAGHAVEIWARALPPRTTSNVAAAFWYPYCAFPRERVLAWAAASLRRFTALADDPDTGVRMCEAIELTRSPAPRPWWADAAGGAWAGDAQACPPGLPFGWCFRAPVVDTRRYMPWLVERVRTLGGRLVVRELADLGPAIAAAPVVVHCAGLGARELAADASVHPIRGQLLHVENPGLSRVMLDEDAADGVAYIVPRGDDCVLGGTAESHVDDTAPRPADRDAILRRCARLDPRLTTARVLADAVGLRPGRPTVRLEAERVGEGLVVHDYGHGGAGITLSWGCAHEVAALVDAHVAGVRPVTSRSA